MRNFPDESLLEKSDISGDVIRGGTIGLNRILNRFVTRSTQDHRPEFTAVILSAFTIFRNVWTMNDTASIEELEAGFVKDVNLFLEYYDTYLAFVKNSLASDKYCPTVVYFPDYSHVDASILREPSDKQKILFAQYKKFIKRFNGRDEKVRQLENVHCFWIRAGDATYPHVEVARKFREIVLHPKSLYSSSDVIALMSHIPIDWYISTRLRGIKLLESYTAEFKSPEQFKLKLDKEGRLPFITPVHVVFGDGVFIKSQISPKIKRQLLEQAEKERWGSRSVDDIRQRLSRATDISLTQLRKFDFS